MQIIRKVVKHGGTLAITVGDKVTKEYYKLSKGMLLKIEILDVIEPRIEKKKKHLKNQNSNKPQYLNSSKTSTIYDNQEVDDSTKAEEKTD